MILLTVTEIIDAHKKLIDQTGGSHGVRDKGLLESAVYGAFHGFGEIEHYKTAAEKAAWLGYSIINNHAFLDGNKRIGVFVMLSTLRLNKISIKYSQQELITLGLDIAKGRIKHNDILVWINNHTLGFFTVNWNYKSTVKKGL